MEVNIYCYLSAPIEGKRKRQDYLTEFLLGIKDYIQIVGRTFSIVWEFSELAPEPNILKHEFVDGGVLLLPFSFQYSNLEKACLRLDLLKTTLVSLASLRNIEVYFEYHLDE